jgi:pyruvate-formate lyase
LNSRTHKEPIMIAQMPEVSRRPRNRDQLAPATSPGAPFEAELRFTETYRRYQHAHVAIREAMCLRAQYPEIFAPIEEGDLFAGRVQPRLVGFSPDEWGSCAFGYYHLPLAIREALERYPLGPAGRRQVEDMLAFWEAENTSAKLRRAYPPDMARYLPSDDWMNRPGVAFPLYRLTGGNVDYVKLMRLGLPGLIQEIQRRRDRAVRYGHDGQLYEGMLIVLEALAEVCRGYERQARELAEATFDPERRRELAAMAEALANIAAAPPRSLREAIQLFWIYALAGDIRNHGRMDVYLGDFLARDLQSGALTEESALLLLQSLWQLMADRCTRVHNRVIVGGLGRPNEANADSFARLAIEATRAVLEVEPQLSLRFYAGMNPELTRAALDTIGAGRTYPILYNDDVNVPAVMAAFEVGRAEAEQYVPFGCGEYILEHRGFGTPSGVINLLKALEVTLHNGRDPLTGQLAGLALGEFRDFATFDELWAAYARQVEHFVRLMADQEALEYAVAGQQAAFLQLSMLYDDCLERGEGIFSGGIRYLGGTLETYGNTNAADSLTAIKELVYDKRLLSPERLLAALDADFAGYARERRLLAGAPKYGNDDDRADEMLLRVHEHVCNTVRCQRERAPLHSYLVVIINNSANALMGRWTAASADGRRASTPMNNGNAPSSGNDRKGITAMLNSIVKPSPAIHAGAVQNMKFSRELFATRRAALEALLETYFAKGGAQAMITVVSRGDLERAMAEPEHYRHIFVRVGGFSARFVDLPRDVQLEILQRTLY